QRVARFAVGRDPHQFDARRRRGQGYHPHDAHGVCPGQRSSHRRRGPKLGATWGQSHRFHEFRALDSSKWLELVKRVAPNTTRVFNPDTAPLLYASAVEAAAPVLSVTPFAAAVHNADEIEYVIEQFARASDGALLVLPDLFTATNRRSIVALAAQHRLPAVYPARYFVASGGLMSYGIELLETYRQAASYVDRILKG